MIFLPIPIINHMQRRVFIQLSAYSAAALALPLATGCSAKPIDIAAQPLFFSHLVDIKTLAEAGKAYLKANQNEDDKNRLKALLLAGSTPASPANDSAIQSMLVSKVNNDFKTGKIATVNGWVLSLTEARQCALFSILQS
jgi:hypothetical protein